LTPRLDPDSRLKWVTKPDATFPVRNLAIARSVVTPCLTLWFRLLVGSSSTSVRRSLSWSWLDSLFDVRRCTAARLELECRGCAVGFERDFCWSGVDFERASLWVGTLVSSSFSSAVAFFWMEPHPEFELNFNDLVFVMKSTVSENPIF
jgi:hypothetical protein